ncbi:MAG: hypothetical protein JHC98_06080 [Thermoleophilaceae bacterium]|nr:hypothetical protein [Thermoleophilaceae bacterium]
MKKTLTLISAMLVVAGVMATQSLAQDNNKGNHGSSRAQIFRATLAPVVSVQPTATVAGSTDATGATGETGSTSATPSGRAQWVQNKKRFNGYVKVRNLTPATVYTAGIYENADELGCASATNTLVGPPSIKSITTDAAGKGSTHAHGRLSAFKLDATKSYYVRVNDATGAAVLCGDLKLKTKKAKKNKSHGKSDKSHGKSDGKAKGHS